VPWDCREAPCPGLAFCDLATGTCLPGCAFDEQCGPNEACQLDRHECGCAPGFHRCGGACVSDQAPATCGGRCEPCPGDANGDAVCTAGTCGLACDSGTLLCGGRCAPCPAGGGASFGCDGDRCVADTCSAGFRLCGGACAACPAAAETGCSGAACVALACPSGQVLCASGCCSWTIETVVSELPSGIDLVLGAGATRWVSYTTVVGGQSLVRAARSTGGAWTAETVIAGGSPADVTAIDLDSTGAPRVASVERNAWSLRVAQRGGSGWVVSTIATSLAEAAVSIAIDGKDKAHVIYEGAGGLRHAFGPPWDSEGLTGFVATPVAAMDAAGGLHVAYARDLEGDLVYLRRGVAGGWTSKTYAPPEPVAGDLAIAVSAGGDARIAYRSDSGRVYVARFAGGWQEDLVTDDSQPSGLALAVHPGTGEPHVVFLDDAQRVVYAVRGPSGWVTSVVAPGTVGPGPVLAVELGPAGSPVIAFVSSAGGLRIAR
jgi:hypothetical protein